MFTKEDKIATIIFLIIMIGLFIVMFIIGPRYTDKEIDKCVNAGHERTFCERNV